MAIYARARAGGFALYQHQLEALSKMKNGCILNGGVGSGKSLTAVAYYYLQNGGSIEFLRGNSRVKDMYKKPMDLYIITTAKKRDSMEWESELSHFKMSSVNNIFYHNTVVVDSWNNIMKYKDIQDAFFIFDEQRVVGYGEWTKSFLKIAKNNRWILLSATPGDTWMDYMPVFIANGFFRNKTDFTNQHVIWSHHTSFPKIDSYRDTGRLIRLRNSILVDMDFNRKTIPHHETIFVNYDKILYKTICRDRFDIWKDEPIQNAAGLCYLLRKIVNTDESRQMALLDIVADHPKVIVFYNFDYELDILKNLFYVSPDGCAPDIAEWNGHKHQPIPDSDNWVYLTQYSAGCEGWNCVKTDTIVFYSENYSYKIMAQAAGRIDRLNTPFIDLYYYHLKSRSGIDLAISKALSAKKKFNEVRFEKTI